MHRRTFDIEELRDAIDVQFARSSGPGGQNVNKVATRVDLLFDFERCDALSELERDRIRRRLKSRLARDGRLRVMAQQSRSQAANRELAEQRLVALLADATAVRKARKKTRPTRASKRRRVRRKRERGEIKRLRQSKPRTDD